jgi:hypothetical protein
LGLPGIGIAFFLMYVFYTLSTTLIAMRLSGFRWGRENVLRIGLLAPVVILVFGLSYILPAIWMAIIGCVLALLAGVYSLRSLYTLFGPEVVNSYIQRIRARLGWKNA